ncbi:uncharacterized protein [Dermacentor albipictus]|uniref:uncharacterized protein n=1 Tax=Dermacentor albipictus TaxID=60249 RepID=UPI0038FC4A44
MAPLHCTGVTAGRSAAPRELVQMVRAKRTYHEPTHRWKASFYSNTKKPFLHIGIPTTEMRAQNSFIRIEPIKPLHRDCTLFAPWHGLPLPSSSFGVFESIRFHRFKYEAGTCGCSACRCQDATCALDRGSHRIHCPCRRKLNAPMCRGATTSTPACKKTRRK